MLLAVAACHSWSGANVPGSFAELPWRGTENDAAVLAARALVEHGEGKQALAMVEAVLQKEPRHVDAQRLRQDVMRERGRRGRLWWEAETAVAKEALLLEAERINPASGLDSARNALRNLQERWEDIGKVPRERMNDLEGRLRAVETRVREAADQQWRRTDPEALARAAQFRDRVAQFEEQAAKAEAAGKTKDAEKARAQAKQWQEWADTAEGAVNER